jgi:hypothetical protein
MGVYRRSALSPTGDLRNGDLRSQALARHRASA